MNHFQEELTLLVNGEEEVEVHPSVSRFLFCASGAIKMTASLDGLTFVPFSLSYGTSLYFDGSLTELPAPSFLRLETSTPTTVSMRRI